MLSLVQYSSESKTTECYKSLLKYYETKPKQCNLKKPPWSSGKSHIQTLRKTQAAEWNTTFRYSHKPIGQGYEFSEAPSITLPLISKVLRVYVELIKFLNVFFVMKQTATCQKTVVKRQLNFFSTTLSQFGAGRDDLRSVFQAKIAYQITTIQQLKYLI